MMNDELLLNSLKQYYEDEKNAKCLISILKDEKKISLRSIDWFITNYSKKNKIYYNIYRKEDGSLTLDENNTHVSNISVFQSYKSQLKAYSKKKFDPFCRRNRIEFDCNGTIIDTTIGQLNMDLLLLKIQTRRLFYILKCLFGWKKITSSTIYMYWVMRESKQCKHRSEGS